MHIITVSRQFGSGGRELGKRLSDLLGWDYYDKEIITALADYHGMEADYVRKILGSHGWHNYQLTYKNSFSQVCFNPGPHTQLLVRQREIIQEIAQAGNDCIIVGRDADVILHEEHPFRVFVCADMQTRVNRCMQYEKKKEESMRLTEKEIQRNIKRIDRNRTRTREILTGKRRGDSSSFDLTVNTSQRDIKMLSRAVADFAKRWFEL